MLRFQTQKRRHATKILVVVGTRGIGDAVAVLPTFELIRQHWPDIYLGAGYFRDSQHAILEMSPYISETVKLFGNMKDPVLDIESFLANLKVIKGYDKVLFLYKKRTIPWTIALTGKIGRTQLLYRHDYEYRDGRKSTHSDFPEDVFFQIVTANLLLELPLCRTIAPRIKLSEQDAQYADEVLQSKGLGHKPVVMLNTIPGCPDWALERYAQLANALIDGGTDVLFNAGAADQVRQFLSITHQLNSEVALLERRSSRQLAAVISKCALYIGAASGPASVAMAVETPTIILQGPGDRDYPGQVRIGPVWWPRDPRFTICSKIAWCQINMGTKCRCSYPKKRRRAKAVKSLMKRLGVGEAWKSARNRLMKPLGINRRWIAPEDDVYPCLEAITVDEVVELAKAQLERAK